MNKSRLFIGSSVEGLNVAYAIQENLKFNAESTIWSQGVFNLSESSLESLLTILDRCDFGVFVFTPDDYIKIRGKKDLTVRDNVLFELGLFIGRLGRTRCYIVVPDNKDFHLPTDLIGLTPAKYEAARTDNNLEAGTGSASNKIRENILKLGSISKSNEDPETKSQKEIEINENSSEDWFEQLYINKDYDSAIKSINKKIKTEKDDDQKIHLKGQICYAKFQKNAIDGKTEFEKLIKNSKDNNISYLSYANVLFWNNSFSKAIEVIEQGLLNCSRKITLTTLKVDCLWETNQKEEAFLFLTESMKILNNPLLYLKLAELYNKSDKKKDALEVLYNGFLEYPNDEDILYQFAKSTYDNDHKDVTILLYRKLLEIKEKNATYWCLLGNAYLDLDFNSKALTCYEKANEFANEKEDWILANIGNLYNRKELYDKAETHLTQAQRLNEKSEYTHARLSSVFLEKAKMDKKLDEVLLTAKEKMNGSIISKDEQIKTGS